MLQINGKIPVKKDSDLSLHNIENLSKTLNFSLCSQACFAWLVNNKDKSFYDLQNILIKKEINLYLIANDKIEENHKLSIPNEIDDKTLKYNCIFSCKNKENVLEEILKYSNSFEENLEKLKLTGYSINKKDNFDDIISKTKDLDALNFKVMHNLIEIDLKEINPKEELQKNLYAIKEKFKQEPKLIFVTKDKNDNQIFGFSIKHEDKIEIVSQYGLLKYKDNKVKVVLLNDPNTWKDK